MNNQLNRRGYRGLQWQMLFSIAFCYLFFYTGRQNFGWTIEGFTDTFGLSKAQAGWVGAGMLWAYAIGQFFNGNLADKFGAKRMMLLGASLSLVMNWASSFATSAMMLAIFWTINGYFQSLGWAPGGRILANWWSTKERGLSFGFYGFAAGCSSVLIYLLAITLTKSDLYINDPEGWRFIFRYPPLLLLLGTIVCFFLLKESPKSIGYEKEALAAGTGDSDEESTKKEPFFSRYKPIFTNKKFMTACLANGFQNAARYGLLIWVPVYYIGTKVKKADNIWVALGLPIGMALGVLFFGPLSDKVFKGNRTKPILIAMSLAGITILFGYLFVSNENIIGGLIVLFLAGFFVYGTHSCFWPLCPDLLGTKKTGIGIGVMNCIAYIFAGLGEPFLGWLIDVTGDKKIVFLAVAGICFTSAFLTLLIKQPEPSIN